MIALSYGITYIWGTVGIILITKYLPNWWGIDAKAAAREYEEEYGVASGDTPTLTRLDDRRPARLPAGEHGLDRQDRRRRCCKANPEYRIVNVVRGGEPLPSRRDLKLAAGRRHRAGRPARDDDREDGPDRPGSLRPRWRSTFRSTRAEILVTNKDVLKLTHERAAGAARRRPDPARQDRARRRAASRSAPTPSCSAWTSSSVVGLKDAVSKVGALFGRVVRPSTATDLLTLSLGMILGFLIGAIQFPAFGASVGLGNAGGLLVSGVIVSSVASRLRFFGNTPNAARNILEDLGLVVFVAIVGINAGNSLLTQLTGVLALKIFLVGFIACSIPPVIVWAHRLPRVQDEPGGADGRRRRRAQPLRPVPRSGGRDPEQRAVDRLPGGLCRLRRAAHGVRLLRDGPGAVSRLQHDTVPPGPGAGLRRHRASGLETSDFRYCSGGSSWTR